MKENKCREETVRAGVQAAIVGVGAHLAGEKQSMQMWGKAQEASGQQEQARARVCLTLIMQSKADLVGLG